MKNSEVLNKANNMREYMQEKKCTTCNGTGKIEGCCFKESCQACGEKGWLAENTSVPQK